MLIRDGWARLEVGDARGALDRFRALGKRDEAVAGLPLFCACRVRARGLRAQGLVREATAMARNAREYRSRFDPGGLDEEARVRFLRFAAPEDAVATFAAFGGDPQVGAGVAVQVVADQLVVGRCWEALSALDESHPLCRGADTVRQALGPMDAGDWEGADALLASVPRRSPYAPWRLFCKAMAMLCRRR